MSKTKFCKFAVRLGTTLMGVSASMALSMDSYAGGTIAYRGLVTSIESTWWANTSGTSFTTWQSDSTAGFARVQYDKSGDYGLNHTLAERNKYSIYIKMWCRQNGGTAAGPKHVKIFSQGYPTFYSNTTFGLAGYGNTYGVYYGDSATGNNDATTEWSFAGYTTGGTVLTRPAPTVVTKTSVPPVIDNNWHEWGYYVKFNDDNTQNGELIVLYDGKEIFHLTNVYNRANGTAPIDNFGVGQWYGPSGGNYSMSRDYRDIRVAYNDWPDSTDLKGNFISGGPRPVPPVTGIQ